MKCFSVPSLLFSCFIVLGITVGVPSFADDSQKSEEAFRNYRAQTEQGQTNFKNLSESDTARSRMLRERIGRLILSARKAELAAEPQNRDYVSKTAHLCVELWAVKYGANLESAKADVAEKFIHRAFSGFKGEKDEHNPTLMIAGLHSALKVERKELQKDIESWLSGEK